MLALLKTFDVFVMSSETEGLGTSILDAMACGKPVVGTSTGGIPEVVEDGVTGLLVEPRDPESLAHAITALLKDEALASADGGGRPGPRARAVHCRSDGRGNAARVSRT